MLLGKLKEECQEKFNGEAGNKISENHRLPCSKRQYQNGLPVYLEILCKVSRKTAVQKRARVFCNY